MLVMGRETAVRMAEYFSKEELQSIYDAAGQLPDLGFDDVNSLAAEFRGNFFNSTLFTSQSSVTDLFSKMKKGGTGLKAMPPKKSGAKGDKGGEDEPLEAETIKLFFETERSQLSAFLIGILDMDIAARALDQIDGELRNRILGKFLNRRELAPEMEAAFAVKLQAFLKHSSDDEVERPEIETAAMLINQISAEAADQVIDFLQGNDAELAANVRKRMFRFENVELLTRDERSKLFDSVQSDEITAMLNGVSESLKECVLDVLSQRNRRLVEADLARSNPSMEVVVEVQRKVTRLALQLAKDGVIALPDGDAAPGSNG